MYQVSHDSEFPWRLSKQAPRELAASAIISARAGRLTCPHGHIRSRASQGISRPDTRKRSGYWQRAPASPGLGGPRYQGPVRVALRRVRVELAVQRPRDRPSPPSVGCGLVSTSDRRSGRSSARGTRACGSTGMTSRPPRRRSSSGRDAGSSQITSARRATRRRTPTHRATGSPVAGFTFSRRATIFPLARRWRAGARVPDVIRHTAALGRYERAATIATSENILGPSGKSIGRELPTVPSSTDITATSVPYGSSTRYFRT